MSLLNARAGSTCLFRGTSLAIFGFLLHACTSTPATHPTRRDCLADEPCPQLTIPACLPGLKPRGLFDFEPTEDLGPTVVVARLELGAIVTPMILCKPDHCCATGHGRIALTAEQSVRAAEFEGVEHTSLASLDDKASIDFQLADGTIPECRTDPSGRCCTYSESYFGRFHLVRGNRVSPTLIDQAEICYPRPEDYPELTLTPGKPYESILDSE